jgi:hypothetical protein
MSFSYVFQQDDSQYEDLIELLQLNDIIQKYQPYAFEVQIYQTFED